MSRFRTPFRPTLPLLLATVGSLSLLTTGALAQWPEEPKPLDSPAWTTLTDSVTPAELRELLLSREANRQRYLEAVARGQAEALSAEKLARLKYCVKGSLTPELVPAWEAFEAFASVWKHRPAWRQGLNSLFEKYGLTSAARRAILEEAEAHMVRRESLGAEFGPQQREFVEILKVVRERLPPPQYAQTLQTRDYFTLSQVTGRSTDDLKRLAAAWNRDLGEEAAEESVRSLQRRLSSEDWKAFQNLLRVEMAPTMSAVEFEGEGEQ